MNRQENKKPRRSKAERTKAAILASAENHLSSYGYTATRLEDIADELDMTRAALFYYFKDKQMLYDAMVTYSFSELAAALTEILDDTEHSIAQRLEMATLAWVDAVVSRPNLARLIMRFVADGMDQPTLRIFTGDEDIPKKFFRLFQEGCENGELNPTQKDPLHAASAILGTTVFYVAAVSALLPNQFEPLKRKQVKSHREEALGSARRLLGIEGES